MTDLKGVRGHPRGFRGHWEGRPVASRWAAATARLSRGRPEGVCARMRQAVLPPPGSHGRREGALEKAGAPPRGGFALSSCWTGKRGGLPEDGRVGSLCKHRDFGQVASVNGLRSCMGPRRPLRGLPPCMVAHQPCVARGLISQASQESHLILVLKHSVGETLSFPEWVLPLSAQRRDDSPCVDRCPGSSQGDPGPCSREAVRAGCSHGVGGTIEVCQTVRRACAFILI